MQILNIRTKFEAFECKFLPFERVWSIRIEILTIRKGFEVFDYKYEPFERDSKHSNPNSNHSKASRTIPKGFEAFESKFEPFESKF